ncbi:MAG: transporter substrate-binding domain-containing protein [candidate division NC10 bacterium]|nr:transporter substrate-binding domain-containing protein [candidate division NC10 bacterium]
MEIKAHRIRLFQGALSYLLTVMVGILIIPSLSWGEKESTLDRIKRTGVLKVCADPDSLPYSTEDPNTPGFDVEIAGMVAEQLGLRLQVVWNETYFTGRAIRRQLFREKKCDCFTGLPIGQYDEDLDFSRPYYGSGYILVVQSHVTNLKSLTDLQGKKIGVEVWTPADHELFLRGYPRGLYRNQREVIEALQKGEVEAGLLWAPTFGWLKKENPALKVKMVEGYVPEPGFQRNVAIGLRKGDHDLKEAMDKAIETLLKNHMIEKIMVRYGVVFYAPFR